MAQQSLVKVTKYSNKIKELPILKRITVDYPLLCQDEVANKLANAANKLPANIYLQVDSAYRTKKTQNILWRLRQYTIPGLVHNPDNGESPHCTGGAVDVTLVASDGTEINLSEPFLKYYDQPQFQSDIITATAQQHRKLLNKIMLDEGFSPNPYEYWHFSYGDSAWAKYYNNDQIYYELELSPKMYFPLYQRVFFRVIKRLWILVIKLFRVTTNY